MHSAHFRPKGGVIGGGDVGVVQISAFVRIGVKLEWNWSEVGVNRDLKFHYPTFDQ